MIHGFAPLSEICLKISCFLDFVNGGGKGMNAKSFRKVPQKNTKFSESIV